MQKTCSTSDVWGTRLVMNLQLCFHNGDTTDLGAAFWTAADVILGGDPWGIRWGSAGDPRGIHAVKWGIRPFCHARCVGFEGDPVTPLNAFIILKGGIRVGMGEGRRSAPSF